MNKEEYVKPIKVKKATYVDGFRVSIGFSDGKNKIVDFGPFLEKLQNSFLEKYKKPGMFKKFAVENGNLVWGEDWDLVFPVDQLYKGKIKLQ